jgi:hypothetical protein
VGVVKIKRALLLAVAVFLGSVMVLGAGVPSAWAAGLGSRGGRLVVVVSGLPRGAVPSGRLVGPGVHEELSTRRLVLHGVRPGRYSLRLRLVVTTRAAGAVHAGARISPVRATVGVLVRAHRRARLDAAWGTIVNPGVVSSESSVSSVGGASDDPASVTLSSSPAGVHVGSILSLAPSAQLPRGVLAKVTSLTSAGRGTQLGLSAVSPFSVVPVAQFDIPLLPVGGNAIHSELAPHNVSVSCDGGSPVTRTISDITFSGGWATHDVLGLNLKTGLEAHVGFNATAGLNDLVGLEYDANCELDISADGLIGPIPVTAGVYGQLGASVHAGLSLSSTASVHVDAGGHTIGVPPLFTFIANASANVGVGVQAGLGEDDVAALTLKFGSELDFAASPGQCRWTEKFGNFSVEGKVLDWDVEGPKTPPFFTNPLKSWSCASPTSGGGGGSGSGSGGGGTGGGSGGGGGTGGGSGGGGGTGGGSGGGSGGGRVSGLPCKQLVSVSVTWWSWLSMCDS